MKNRILTNNKSQKLVIFNRQTLKQSTQANFFYTTRKKKRHIQKPILILANENDINISTTCINITMLKKLQKNNKNITLVE